jgi:hypothetical protein
MITNMKLKITGESLAAVAEHGGYARDLEPGDSITIGGARISVTDAGIEIVQVSAGGITQSITGNVGSATQIAHVRNVDIR